MNVVLGHTNADLDAVASMIAATRLFPDTIAVRGRQVAPPVHRFLALHKDKYIFKDITDIDASQIKKVYVVDTCDRRRIKEFEALLPEGAEFVIFDHHPPTEHDLDSEQKRVESVGACITLLVEEMIAAGVEIPPDDATLYMLGLYSDTGRLSYATTTARDFDVAKHLLTAGANLRVVSRYLRDVLTDEQSSLLQEMIQTTEEVSIRSVEFAIARAHPSHNVRGASAVIQRIMEFGGHDAIFGFIQNKRRIQVIGRSRVSYIDVGRLLTPYGGGGHAGAGAASFKDEAMDDVIQTVLAGIRESDFQPVRVKDLMSSPMETIASTMTLRDAREYLTTRGFHGAPVEKDGEIVGVISKRDIAKAIAGDHLDLPVASHMTVKPKTIDLKEPIEDALDEMTRLDVGRLLVTDGDEYVGIVTRTDLIRRLYQDDDPADDI